jgi:predicted nicotinamide N-methyase
MVLGWALERRDSIQKHYQVTVAWTHDDLPKEDDDDDEATTTTTKRQRIIELPFVQQPDSLASSLWPASLAGAILFSSPSWRQQLQSGNVLELGSGVGLAGLAAAASSASSDLSSTFPSSFWLTDYDPQAVELLRESIQKNSDLQKQQLHVVAQRLDWRDAPELQHLVVSSSSSNTQGMTSPNIHVVLGTDVCYYFHLLRPLMDTIQRKLVSPALLKEDYLKDTRDDDKLVCLVGQANRQSLWDMYHNIANGCYNQITDQRDPPWPGTTCMLLYQLYMTSWSMNNEQDEQQGEDDWNVEEDIKSLNQSFESILPIAAIVHQRGTTTSSPSLVQPYDHMASQADEDAQMKSF